MRSIALLGIAGLLVAAPIHAAEIDSEDFNHLKGHVTAQDEAIDSFRATLQQLRQEIARLRTDNESIRTQLEGTKNLASQEQLSKLADQVREVDKNRAKDKEQILEAIEKLKALPPPVVPDPPKAEPKPKDKTPDKTDAKPGDKAPEKSGTDAGTKGDKTDKSGNGEKAEKTPDAGPELPTEYFEHKVEEGQTLGAIIEAYNKQHGLKVRLAHVLKANPTLKDPKKLKVGQTIRIPAVK